MRSKAKPTETPQISMQTAVAENVSVKTETAPQSQNKCRISAVLAEAHELYNVAYIGGTR
ncbi:MAG: hypothetical protein NC453_27925 [Muribaculum sp.]|nr:hypothetical protein [Muribaculum sp.]